MKNKNSKHYDAIVVGSGPGGATVAKALTEKNKNVLILERGGNAKINGSLTQMAMTGGIPGKHVMFTDRTFLAIIRGIVTGGSTIFYCASAFEPPYEMMESYGIDIRNEVEALKSEIPTGPLNDDLFGKGARRIMESAVELGYDWKKLNKFIYQEKCKTDCNKCSYGCPYGAKWTARNFVEKATDNGAELINGAKVNRVLFSGKKAVGVEFTIHCKTRKVFADKIIVSAGGTGTPVILQKSGLRNAGQDFFFDPLIMVFGTVDKLKSKGEVQMSAGAHMQEDGYMMVDLNFPLPIFAAQTAPKFKIHKAISHSDTLMIMIKIKDDLGGKIKPGGGIRKSLSKNDRLKLKSGYERAKIILENAGAKDVYSGWHMAAHPGGTAKINEVVDANLKTEYDNLYVCDCSVIPEPWGLPPTFTLLALGKRLASHLINGGARPVLS
ncbi:MAG: GMC family oxidoreductase [Thermodesulfobacteriota bacterium]